MPRLRLTAVAVAVAAILALALVPAAHAAGAAATTRALTKAWQGAGAAGAYVIDLGTRQQLFAAQPRVRRIPASVNKLFTTATALERYGADGTLSTDVLAAAAQSPDGVVGGDLYLHGGGDPTFGAAQARSLARALAADGLTAVRGRVIGDESAWDTLRGGPESGYLTSEWAGPLSALAYDEGFTGERSPVFQAQPARFAATAFTQALRKAGVTVRRAARSGPTPPGATTLMSWVSPSVASIVARTNTPSDNYMAEELLKGLGAAFGAGGSTAAGTAVVRSTVQPLGAWPRMVDGSGLSRRDAVAPRSVVRLLTSMDASPLAAPFEASLPVAGETGTLQDRMRATAARGRCHAKTGTLSDVSALAGICDTVHGRRVAFAFLMNRASVYWAHVRQDRLTTILAAYG